MRQRPSSISRRLLTATLLSMPLVLGLTGFAIENAHHASLIQGERDRLQLQFFGILGAMEWRDGGIEMGDRLKEPRFWQFRSGLYAEIQDTTGQDVWRSLSAETLQLPSLPPPGKPGEEEFSEVDLGQEPFFAFRYQAIWETEQGKDVPLTISLYSQQGSFREALAHFRHQLVIWLSLVLLFSLVLFAGILYWGLYPLRHLAKDLLDLERGDSQQLDNRYPKELKSVTRNLNKLLDSEQRQRERYRNTLGDLAHSLKTPIAVLKAEPENIELGRQQLERMENIINYQLNRAVGGSQNLLQRRQALFPVLDSLKNTLLKVYHQKAPTISIDVSESLQVAADKQDLFELFGNLLDNACKACKNQVSVVVEGKAICIDDDGPGVSPDQRDSLLDRGRRGDQYGQGQGLGLSIVRDIIDSYGGKITFGDSPLGGCRVAISLD